MTAAEFQAEVWERVDSLRRQGESDVRWRRAYETAAGWVFKLDILDIDLSERVGGAWLSSVWDSRREQVVRVIDRVLGSVPRWAWKDWLADPQTAARLLVWCAYCDLKRRGLEVDPETGLDIVPKGGS